MELTVDSCSEPHLHFFYGGITFVLLLETELSQRSPQFYGGLVSEKSSFQKGLGKSGAKEFGYKAVKMHA